MAISEVSTQINLDRYLADAAWKLLEIPEQIGGSGETDGAARREDELYGPVRE